MMTASLYVRRILGLKKYESLDLASCIEHLETMVSSPETVADYGQSIVMAGWKEVQDLPAEYADVLDNWRQQVSMRDSFDSFGAGFGVIIAAARQEKFRQLSDAEWLSGYEYVFEAVNGA
jgi:hypothetical protein